MTVAEQVKRLMDEQHLRPIDLASRAHTTEQTIRNLLAGDNATLKTLQAVAKALGAQIIVE
jgi:transcriptional regulator with XRE-family HTH domain